MSRFSNLVWHTGDSILGHQICSDGTYIYVAATNYIAAYQYSGGVLNELARESRNAKNICTDGNYIYTNVKPFGVYAYSFNGSSFTQEGYLSASRYGVGCDNNYVYSCSTSRMYAYTFNGTLFSEIDNCLLGETLSNEADINTDSNYITCNASVFVFNGSTLVKVCEVDKTVYSPIKMRLFPDISNNIIYGIEYNFSINSQGCFSVFSFNGIKTQLLAAYDNLYSNLKYINFNNGYAFVAGIDATGTLSSRIYAFKYVNSRLFLKEIYELATYNFYDVFADNTNVYILHNNGFEGSLGVLDFDYSVLPAAAQPESTLLIPVNNKKAMCIGSKVINDDFDTLLEITDYKGRSDYQDVLHNIIEE